MKDLIKKEDLKTLWQEKVDDLFIKTKDDEMHTFLSILTIMMNDKYDERLVCLYEIINDVSVFSKIVDQFSGLTITIPNKEEFIDTLIVALSYYYKEIKDMSWKDIQREIPYEDNIAIKASKGIIKLKKEMKNQLELLLKSEHSKEEV